MNPFHLVPTHNIAKVWAASNAPSQADFGPKLQAKSAFLHKSLKELQPIFQKILFKMGHFKVHLVL